MLASFVSTHSEKVNTCCPSRFRRTCTGFCSQTVMALVNSSSGIYVCEKERERGEGRGDLFQNAGRIECKDHQGQIHSMRAKRPLLAPPSCAKSTNSTLPNSKA